MHIGNANCMQQQSSRIVGRTLIEADWFCHSSHIVKDLKDTPILIMKVNVKTLWFLTTLSFFKWKNANQNPLKSTFNQTKFIKIIVNVMEFLLHQHTNKLISDIQNMWVTLWLTVVLQWLRWHAFHIIYCGFVKPTANIQKSIFYVYNSVFRCWILFRQH